MELNKIHNEDDYLKKWSKEARELAECADVMPNSLRGHKDVIYNACLDMAYKFEKLEQVKCKCSENYHKCGEDMGACGNCHEESKVFIGTDSESEKEKADFLNQIPCFDTRNHISRCGKCRKVVLHELFKILITKWE